MTRIFSAFLLLLCLPLYAAAAPPQGGAEYKTITPEQPTISDEKMEVVEAFSYACPHCYRFQPSAEAWLKTKPAGVKYVRLPMIFRPEWEIYARAYFTVEALGLVDKMHLSIFKAVHGERQDLSTEAAMEAFFEKMGVKKADFNKTFRSFAVEGKIRRAKEMGRRYNIDSTPSLVINGKYRTNSSMVQGQTAERVWEVVDELLKKG